MDRLLTFSGGQPLTTGDLDFLQNCYAKTFESLATGLARGRDCILHGILSDADGGIQPGAVCVGGEILPVESAVQRTAERYLCFRLREEDSRVFADSQEHKVIRRVEAYVSDSADGAYKYLDLTTAIRLHDVISGESEWQEVPDAAFSGANTGHVEYNPVRNAYRVTVNRISPFSSTVLFSIKGATGVYRGIAINNFFKPYSMWMGNGTCSVYNIDGTQIEMDTELHFSNIILTASRT